VYFTPELLERGVCPNNLCKDELTGEERDKIGKKIGKIRAELENTMNTIWEEVKVRQVIAILDGRRQEY
jgi:hypothetical protein